VEYFTTIFGDKLAVPDVDGPGELPSPEELRGKILIKGKRLEPDGSFVDQNALEEDARDDEEGLVDDCDRDSSDEEDQGSKTAFGRSQSISADLAAKGSALIARRKKMASSVPEQNRKIKVIPELSAITYLTTTINLLHRKSPWVYNRRLDRETGQKSKVCPRVMMESRVVFPHLVSFPH
jgi:hypothetical protein